MTKTTFKTSIGEICTQSLVINGIAWKINREILQVKEATKHACKNCLYFDNNGYLPCAVNPLLASTNWLHINECRDFVLKDNDNRSGQS